jgi:hypothetical protein
MFPVSCRTILSFFKGTLPQPARNRQKYQPSTAQPATVFNDVREKTFEAAGFHIA